ncbi:MAG TPA: VOC family protein [Ktedonobacteraceae bacterium]|jgi:predicted enzyme related to lactoylglutathione lyase
MALEIIKLTTVYVHDQDAALDFYVDKLGMEKRIDNVFGPGIRFLVVAPKGSEAGIVLQAGKQNNRPVGGFTGLVFSSSDVESTYQELQSRGVPFTEKPTAQTWGAMQAQFTDLDGNGFVLHSN